jgi:hypothetical protein
VPADTLANRLMLARALAGHLSIREAADLCGLGRGAWTKWERGTRPADVLEIVPIIAAKLDVDEHWLLWGGPLESARGREVRRTKRSGDVTRGYPRLPIRPTPARPKVRTDSERPISPSVLGRRPNRVTADQLAAAVQHNVMQR